MNQLFLISDEAWRGASPQETAAICADLKELGLLSLPYPVIDIGVSFDAAVRFVDSNGKPSNEEFSPLRRIVDGYAVPPLGSSTLLIYRNVSLDADPSTFSIAAIIEGIPCTPQELSHLRLDPHMAAAMARLLIALLATKNVRREVQRNKLAALGIGRKKGGLKQYSYITTLHPPEPSALEDEAGSPVPSGRKKIPHLRRGHIRRKQHYGPNNQFTRSVWIAPIFINASDEVLATRQAYNFSIRKETTACKSTPTSSSEATSPSSSSSASPPS